MKNYITRLSKAISGAVITSSMLSIASPAKAVGVIFDQIGDGTPTDIPFSILNQDFEADFDDFEADFDDFEADFDDIFDSVLIDDFTVEGTNRLNIVKADAVFRELEGLTGDVSGATLWNVAIFSSPDAAGTSIIGDIANAVIDSAEVSLTKNFNNQRDTLVEIPVDLSLPSKGTYWLGIYPTLDFDLFGPSFLTMSLLADDTVGNSILANPGGGLGVGDRVTCTDLGGLSSRCNASYRLEAKAVPEPGITLSLLAFGAIGTGVTLKKKRYF